MPPQRRLGGPGKIGFAIGFCLWFLSPILLQPPLPILLLYSDPSSHQSSRNRRSQLKWSIFSVSCFYSPNPIDVQCCESAPISCLKICLLNILWRLWLWSRPSCHSHRKPSAYLGKWKHQTMYPMVHVHSFYCSSKTAIFKRIHTSSVNKIVLFCLFKKFPDLWGRLEVRISQ